MTSSNFLALPFERNFMPTATVNFANNNWPLVIGIVIGYVAFITVGTMVMAKQAKPFDLRLPLAAWNAFLCVFSFIGMLKTVRSSHPFPNAYRVPNESCGCISSTDALSGWIPVDSAFRADRVHASFGRLGCRSLWLLGDVVHL
jgi:hypothetical protein